MTEVGCDSFYTKRKCGVSFVATIEGRNAFRSTLQVEVSRRSVPRIRFYRYRRHLRSAVVHARSSGKKTTARGERSNSTHGLGQRRRHPAVFGFLRSPRQRAPKMGETGLRMDCFTGMQRPVESHGEGAATASRSAGPCDLAFRQLRERLCLMLAEQGLNDGVEITGQDRFQFVQRHVDPMVSQAPLRKIVSPNSF